MSTDPRLRAFAVYSRLGGIKAVTLVEPDGRRTRVIFAHGCVLPVTAFMAALVDRLVAVATNPWPRLSEEVRRVWRLTGEDDDGSRSASSAAEQAVGALVADLRGPDARENLRAFLRTIEDELACGEETIFPVDK